MKCTVFRVKVPYFYTSVLGKVDRMLAGLSMYLTFFPSASPVLHMQGGGSPTAEPANSVTHNQ